MSTTTPEIYYKNMLRYCDEGVTDQYGNFRLGAGVVAATHASGFDGTTDISERRFVWSANTPTTDNNLASAISDAAMSSTYEGGTLRFTTSGRRHKVTTIDATSKFFELEDTPNTNDDDSEFEYLLGTHHDSYQAIWENDVANTPATNMHDEFLHTTAKSVSTASNAEIHICLPNLLKDAAFGGAAVGSSFVADAWYNTTATDWNKATGNVTHGDENIEYVNTAAVAEVTDITIPAGSGLTGGTYFNIWSATDTTAYYVWFTVDGGGSDPAPGGKTAIGPVAVNSGDTSTQTAFAVAGFINANADFSATSSSAVVTVTNASIGITTNAADVDAGVTPSVTTQGTSTAGDVSQFGQFAIEKGKTYILKFYLRSVTANTDADALTVSFLSWDNPAYDAFTDGATLDSSVGAPTFSPTSAGAFVTQEFVAGRDAPGFRLVFRVNPLLLGSATAVNIELAYLYEKQQIDTLIVGDMPPGGNFNIDVFEYPWLVALNGTNPSATATLLTSWSPAENREVKALDAASSGPTWRIRLQATTAQEYHIGQLWLTKKFDLERSVQSPHDPDMRRVQFQNNVALSGAKHHKTDFEERVVNGETRIFTTAQMDTWLDWWNCAGRDFRSFWYRHTSTGDLLFVVNDQADFERAYNGAIRSISFRFKEQK